MITIIGAGISGLTLAWWLHKEGLDVTVVESDSSVGGTMKTLRDGDWLIETGPNSALATTPLFDTLSRELGIESEICFSKPSAKKRYILRDGKLHMLPMSPLSFLNSGLWSCGAKWRLLKEPFISRADKEETLAQFVERRLGREFLDYAINPFVAGVYAGDPAQLSVRDAFPKLYALEKEHGSLIRGAMKKKKRSADDGSVAKNRAEMFSYRMGMQSLPLALHKALGNRVRTGIRVHALSRSGNDTGEFIIKAEENGRAVEWMSDKIVLAVPAYTAGKCVEDLAPETADILKSISYAPAAEIFLGYPASAVRMNLDGFGFLIPEKEKRSILGAIWTSSIFDGRMPEGHVAFTVFVGGARQPELVDQNESALTVLAETELNLIMGIQGSPVYSRVHKWIKAIPQYRIGHGQMMNKLAKTERSMSGLYFTGNYRGGISVGDCLMQSDQLAKRIVKDQTFNTQKNN
ncbi:protoporphyrinogen oxidase [bacterium]|nr:MAG: protoporphyrinogen oxidase [bacterium]